MRPRHIDDLVGQEQAFGEDTPLRKLLLQDKLPSLILWGPPGCGKTTFANVCAAATKRRFKRLSAVTAGVKDVRDMVAEAERVLSLKVLTRCHVHTLPQSTTVAIHTCLFTQQRQGQRTVLFVDEVHRFNKAQQDAFLPHVESGVITLLGATTENPSFSLNSALLSRSKVVVLNKLTEVALGKVLRRALQQDEQMRQLNVELPEDVCR